jgi:protein ImuB
MSRVMTIWLPRWPVQRRLVERPERRQAPLLVCHTEPRGVQRVVGWAWAAARIKPPRIPCGQTLAETLAALALSCGSQVCRMAEVDQDDPQADRQVLEGIARWCRRFSPTTALEDAEHPECIHVDLAGTADLLGGEQMVVRTAVWTLASRGLYARAAVADTPSAAWAAAHHPAVVQPGTVAPACCGAGSLSQGSQSAEGGPDQQLRVEATAGQQGKRQRRKRWAVIPPGRQVEWLASLPVAALRIPQETIALLDELGVLTIGQLLKLPRKSVASRLGPLVARRLAEFEGSRSEPLQTVADEAFPHAECHLSAPAATFEAVRWVLKPLVEQCLSALHARGFGVTVLQVRLSEAALASSRAAPVVIDIGLFRPSVSARHVLDLVQLRMARMRLPREVESIAVEVVSAGAVASRQRVLFDGVASAATLRAGEQAVQLGGLLDRLAGRLGRMAVFEPRPVVDAQPEHAWVAAPPTPGHAASSVSAVATVPCAAGVRPIWMTPRPIRVETVSVVPDGPPLWFCISGVRHRVTEAWGPERIETAWWRGCSVRRDYYVVETESGDRWWLFRHLGESGGRPGQLLRGSRRSMAASQASGDHTKASERTATHDRGAWFVHGQFA